MNSGNGRGEEWRRRPWSHNLKPDSIPKVARLEMEEIDDFRSGSQGTVMGIEACMFSSTCDDTYLPW